MTILVMSVVATLVCEIISYLLQIILFGVSIEIVRFIKIILIEILYNSMIIIIIYPIIKKAGITLERIFTQSKILTRYY